METILQLDRELLLYLNNFRSPVFDNFFWVITSIIVWSPLYLSFVYVVFKEQGRRGIITLLNVVLLVFLCDLLANQILKEGFARLRPSREASLKGIIYLVNDFKAGEFGFVSGHATNSFGLAVFTSLLLRYRWYTVFIFSWALLMTYSRIYLGVHYPTDILGGIIIGTLIALGVFWIHNKVQKLFLKKMKLFASRSELEFSTNSIGIIILTGIVTIVVIYISAKLLLDLM